MNSNIGLKKIKEFKRINIYLHWSVILLFLIPLINYKEYLSGLIFETSIVLMVIIHEFGHAIFARFFNYKVNDIIIHALGGNCIIEEPEYRREALFISSGGVILQAATTIIILLIMSVGNVLSIVQKLKYLNSFCVSFIILNILFIIVNLLPIKPLDGHTIWGLLFERKNSVKQNHIPVRKKKRSPSDEEIKRDVDKIMSHINNMGKRNK